MYKNLTKWLGVIDNTEEEEVIIIDEKGEERVVKKQANVSNELNNPETVGESEKQESQDQENDDLISPQTKQALEEVSAKAINTAKEWGNILYTFGKHATEVVTEKAKEITRTVEEKTFLCDFTKEQEKFVAEHKEKDKKSEAAVPPWVGYNEEVAMKSQILALSQDKRNFIRNPPAGIQFQFDFGTVFPVAMATLQEDPNLKKMRFELVPKQINEETFWRNYFYRVSLIKQSMQLTSMAQQTGNTDNKSDSTLESSTGSDKKDNCQPKTVEENKMEEELEGGSLQHDNEFVSDTFQGDDHISDEDIKKEMQMLGMEGEVRPEDLKEHLPEWEQELQRELQDYEMVNNTDDVDDPDIESEILKQIEESADT